MVKRWVGSCLLLKRGKGRTHQLTFFCMAQNKFDQSESRHRRRCGRCTRCYNWCRNGGLTCAVYLKQAGIQALVLEATDGVGGRVRTDQVDGFLLDRGFQILLTAYPEARRLLNFADLDLQSFRSGALIRKRDHWLTLLNPFQEPLSVFKTWHPPSGRWATNYALPS